jgi:NADH-quinone oxidoreductase subunit L
MGEELIHSLGWLIPGLPLAAFVAISAFCLRPPREKAAPHLLVGALAGSLLLSLAAAHTVAGGSPAPLEWRFDWLNVGNLKVEFGLLFDPLSVNMLAVVCLVSVLVQVYSIGYMRGELGYGRYFAYMALFSGSMLGLVISNNLLETYFFWELVGLCSYLLIGFWYRKPEAASAAKKAFVVTRFGDVGFLVGLLLLSVRPNPTFNFGELAAGVRAAALAPGLVTALSLLLFSGAVGKSAQFPLHVWLPDAMEGPTPVSALIHAATMVAAGVYLVARNYFFFAASPLALGVVAVVGAVTLLLAASIGVAQSDIKRILAYSTISQLGYMMLALGVGGYAAALFHLTTHAFFKALLFLAAGSVIHALRSNNIWEMGGLHGRMKITSFTCLIGALALAGVFPLSGFWSKDEILAAALARGSCPLFLAALAAVFLTAFYMFRLWFVVFTGKPRTQAAADSGESPAVMTGPLLLFAALAAFAGLLKWRFPFAGEPFHRFLGAGVSLPAFGAASPGHHELPGLMILSTLVALSGIATAWAAYRARLISPAAFRARLPWLAAALRSKYWIDDAYLWVMQRGVLAGSLLAAWFDRHVINGAVDGVSWLLGRAGAKLRRTESGQLQFYALVIFAGVLLAMLLLGLGRPGGPTGLEIGWRR